MKRIILLFLWLLTPIILLGAGDNITQGLWLKTLSDLPLLYTSGGIDNETLEDNDFVIIADGTGARISFYIFDLDSGVTESYPTIITPDEISDGVPYTGDGRWKLVELFSTAIGISQSATEVGAVFLYELLGNGSSTITIQGQESLDADYTITVPAETGTMVTTASEDYVAAAEMADADHGHVSWSSGNATVEDFALNADADAGDFDIHSLDGLYGVDDNVYIDLGTDGYLDIEADTAIRMLGPVDMGVNALDCDSNTVTLSTVSGAIDAGGATSLEIPNSDDPDVDAAGEISWDTDGWMRAYDGSAQVAIARKLEEIHVTVVAPNDLDDAVRDKFVVWSNESGMSFIVTGWKAWSGTDNTELNIEEYDADGKNNATVDAVNIQTDGTGIYTASDTSITGATIENGHLIALDFDDTDTPTYVKITIYGYYNADVN